MATTIQQISNNHNAQTLIQIIGIFTIFGVWCLAHGHIDMWQEEVEFNYDFRIAGRLFYPLSQAP